MDTSSSLAPFAFILRRSCAGSEHSCFGPARKLHLKLALRSEWLIGRLAGLEVNERSKVTASPLPHSHPARLPEKVSQSCDSLEWEKIRNGGWVPFSFNRPAPELLPPSAR